MAGPLPIDQLQVPRRILRAASLPETVSRTEKYVTDRAQFDQTYFTMLQRGLTDNNGQATGGIVNAADLAARVHPYQFGAAVYPHVGDLPSQPAAVSYDGPLKFGALPAGVNATYGYARWCGWLNIATAGTYSFNLVSTGGSNLFVNKAQVIGGLASASTNVSANATLAVGIVPICVEWQWETATPSLALNWTPPGGALALIPASVMARSLNQISQFLVGYWFNGSAACWYP